MQTKSVNTEIAEIKVSYTSKLKFSEMPTVTTSAEAALLLRKVWSDTMQLREEFYLLLLNRANKVIGYFLASQGGTSATIVDPKLIFPMALKCNANGLILAHNHPSGNLKPSEEDRKLTKKLVECGKLLDISVLDHLILTTEAYTSFADEGWI